MRRRTYGYSDPKQRIVEGMTRDEVCEHFRSKVLLLARRVFERLSPDASVQLEDLVSCGAIGLLEAFDRFEPSRGIKFTTYAEYRIRGAMYDALRTQDTFTRRRRQLARRVEQSTEEVRKRVDREPTPHEVAEYMGISLDEYWAAVDRVKPINHVSIDGPSSDEDARPLLEKIMTNPNRNADIQITVAEIKHQLQTAIEQLPERQRQCVLMYYGKEMSLAEIAAVYGITVSRVSQVLSDSRTKLRKKLMPFIDKADLSMELEA
jgi:RNA polymerase sigma factor for flagellar operon FliA